MALIKKDKISELGEQQRKKDTAGYQTVDSGFFFNFHLVLVFIVVHYCGIFNLEEDWRLVSVLLSAFVSLFAGMQVYCRLRVGAAPLRSFFHSAAPSFPERNLH